MMAVKRGLTRVTAVEFLPARPHFLIALAKLISCPIDSKERVECLLFADIGVGRQVYLRDPKRGAIIANSPRVELALALQGVYKGLRLGTILDGVSLNDYRRVLYAIGQRRNTRCEGGSRRYKA